MSRSFHTLALALLGVASNTLACDIPATPPSNTITEKFSIFVQNPAIPAIHNRIMNFRPNGFDKHLVLRPAGDPTFDLLSLDNGLLRYETLHAVIDLEHNPADDTTKMFITDRTFHPEARFRAVYACDPDTDALQIQLELVSRGTTPLTVGGQIGIQTAGDTWEFRYSPPNNPLLDSRWLSAKLVVFRDGISPPVPSSTTTTTTAIRTTTTLTTTTRTSTAPTSSTTTRSTTTTSAGSTPTGSLPPIGDYKYVSCWAEPPTGRALTGALIGATDMTLEKCAELCSEYPYFGTQWSVECWCGSTLSAGSASAPASDCDRTCGGNSAQTCGGSRRLSLYHNDEFLVPSQPEVVGNYEFHGCVTDRVGQRTLSASSRSSSDMTLEQCATFCEGFTYFGTEWSVECFCGNSLTEGSSLVDNAQCDMPCGGNKLQYCGKGERLSVYKLAGV